MNKYENSKKCINNKVILCAASGYNKKYYFNPKMNNLPAQIKDELKAVIAVSAEKAKAIIIAGFNSDGELYIETSRSSNDFNFDEIGAIITVENLIREREKLFKSIKIWYNIFILKSNNIDLKS